MATKSPQVQNVSVCFVNFDSISQKLIMFRLKDPQYAINLITTATDADVCFYNQEHSQENAEIEALIEQLKLSDIPMILLTDESSYSDGELFTVITKPIENRRLSDYLYQVKDIFYAVLVEKLNHKANQKRSKLIYNNHLSNAINPSQIQFENNRFYAQKYVGLNTDIDFTDTQQLEKIQMNPQSYFFYYLKAAYELSKSKKKTSCVKTVYGTFYVDALDKVIYHQKTAEEIFNIHKIPFYKDTKVFIPKLKRGELDALNPFDYEPFVWLSSINASKGKIPNDINFNAPVKLVAWPDLTKLIVFKHAIRIIALWSRGVYSLKNTGKLLNIPQRYPLTVYTAMDALGLIDEVKRR